MAPTPSPPLFSTSLSSPTLSPPALSILSTGGDIALDLGIAVLGAMATYGAILWLMGIRRLREEAVEVFLHAVFGAVLFAVALVIGAVAVQAAEAYYDYAKVKPMCFNITRQLPQWLRDYPNWVGNATSCAAGYFSKYADAAAATLSDMLSGVAVLGVLPVVQQFAFSFMQLLFVVASAATSLIAASIAARVASLLLGNVAGMLLLTLAAIAVTHERTRVLGAIVLGVATAAPVLVALADTLMTQRPPDSLKITGWQNIFTFWDWGAVVDKGKAIYEAAVTAGIGLSIFVAVAAAVAYLFSRVPHAVGVE